MKLRHILKVYSILLAALTLLAACSKTDPEPSPTEYAVILYGTTGGEMDYLVEDVWEEIQTVLPDNKVRVFCCYKYGDGGDNFSGKYGDRGELLTFELRRDTDFEKLRDYGLRDSTFELFDSENLAQVLAWAQIQANPSKGCILTFYGHGGGFVAAEDFPKGLYGVVSPATRGVIYDEWFKYKVGMNMYEIARAIERSGVGRLAGIMFHNCQMGSIEWLTELIPYTDYFIATPFLLSSENEPLIPYLVKNLPGRPFEDAARLTILESKDRLIDGLRHEDPDDFPGNVELLKSSELAQVCKAAKALAHRLCELYPDQQEAIDRATCKVYRFFGGDPYFDLLDYARILAQETDDRQLKTIASEMEKAFGDAILEQIVIDSGTRPVLDSYSLSVVLTDHEAYNTTPTRGLFSYRQAYQYSSFHQYTGWGTWLDTNLQYPTGNPCGQSF